MADANCGQCGLPISSKARIHGDCFPQYKSPEWEAADPKRCLLPLPNGERCEKRIVAQKWCKPHWQIWTRHGDPTYVSDRRIPGELLAKVKEAARTSSDECFLVPCKKSRPSLTYRGKPMPAARAVWIEATGDDPGEDKVRFTCERADDGCINFLHLYLDSPDPGAVCSVCEKPPEESNPLKGGMHIRYCYQWFRRNNPDNGICTTPGCDRPIARMADKICDRCGQRKQRGNDPTDRPFYVSHDGGKECKVSWCTEKTKKVDWCERHYAWRQYHNGDDPENSRRYAYNRTPADIMAMVIEIESDPATGCRNSHGVFFLGEGDYPITGVGGKAVTVTRLVVEQTLGRRMKRRTQACHSCDNPPCVEPNHLWEGTSAENTRDREAKGRGAKGERNGRTQLDPAKIRALREECILGTTKFDSNVAELAVKYGLKPQQVRNIVNRRAWKHVD